MPPHDLRLVRGWTLSDFPRQGERGPAWAASGAAAAPEVASGSTSQTHGREHARARLGALAKLCSPGNLYSHWAQAPLSDRAPRAPQSPSLHTEVLGCEAAVNHHFGILHCFWVNCLCSPFLPFRQKVGSGGWEQALCFGLSGLGAALRYW